MIGIFCYGQAPQAFSYQAVAIGDGGTALTNQTVSIKVNINMGNAVGGTTAYSETHSPTTSDMGLFSLEVGHGTPINGVFTNIDWSTGAYFLSVEIDQDNNGTYQNLGMMQLLSVPYALYAENGIQGPAGPQGATGAPGDKGAQGATGATSPQGPAGSQGPQGDPGDPGEIGVPGGGLNCWDLNMNMANDLEEDRNQDGIFSVLDCGGITGITGPKGQTGNQGPASTIQGPPGEIGFAGAKGDQGPAGPKGPTIECSPWEKLDGNIYYLGNVGVGTNSPTCALDVIGDIASYGISLSSDLRYKTNVTQLQSMLDKVMQLEGVTYLFKTKEFAERSFSKELQVGLIAQEVEKVFPQLVTTKADGYKAVNYSKLSPILLEAIRNLNVEMEEVDENLNNQYQKLDSEIEELKATLTNNY